MATAEDPLEIELTNTDFDRLTAVAFRNFKKAGLAPDDAQREAVSYAYAAAEVLRERIADAVVEYAR